MPTPPNHEFRAAHGGKDVLLITSDEKLLHLIGGMVDLIDGASLVSFTTANLPSPALWAAAPLIFVANDAQGMVDLYQPVRFPRREKVVLVTDDLDDAGIWRRAVAIGAEHVAFVPDAVDWIAREIAEVGANADPYCGACNLPQSNVIHKSRVDVADLEYSNHMSRVAELTAQAIPLALECVRARAYNDNPKARYIGVNYNDVYFGHGASGPATSCTWLYDVDGNPLLIPVDGVAQEGELDNMFEDDNAVGNYVGLINTSWDIPTRDDITYLLDLEDGEMHGDEQPVKVKDWVEGPDDDDDA